MNESKAIETEGKRGELYPFSAALFLCSFLSFLMLLLLFTRIGEYLQWPYLTLALLIFFLPPLAKKLRLGKRKSGAFFELASIAFSGFNFFTVTYFTTEIPIASCFSGWVLLLALWLLIRK